MSNAQEMERFFRERGFGQLIGWGDSPALLVIDFTRAFTNPALPLGSNLDRELAETVGCWERPGCRDPHLLLVRVLRGQGLAGCGSLGQEDRRDDDPACWHSRGGD